MTGCSCGENKVTIIYACSGAANTGLLADQVARKMRDNGIGGMSCLAGIGAGISGFVESAKSADKNIVIDGCPMACAKKIFENNGLPYEHFILTEYGVEKGKTAITGEVIERVCAEVTEKSGGSHLCQG